jgi:outer membrane lipoprotein-sorting protein
MRSLIPNRWWLPLALALCLPATGCLFHTHRVEVRLSSAHLQTATQQELIERISANARQIRTLNAIVDIDTSIGGVKKGEVTEYQEVRGYILVRQPGMLRMIGLMPVIRNHAFDMVSNGTDFKLWVPATNKFYAGPDNVVAPGATGLTSLRPQIIYDALLLDDISANEDIAVLESGVEKVLDPKTHKEVDQDDYRLDVIHRGVKGWRLARKIYFDRVLLHPRRQRIYDEHGTITSESQYADWKQYGEVWFPSWIRISRPQEEYQITLGVVKLTINEPLTDQQFTLDQPPGAQVIHLGEAAAAPHDTHPE